MDPYCLEQLRDCCQDDAAFERMKAILVAEARQQSLESIDLATQEWHRSHAESAKFSAHTAQEIPPPASTKDIRRSLLKVIAKIHSSLEPAAILCTAVMEIRYLLAVDRVAIFRFTADTIVGDGKFVAEEVLPSFPSLLSEHQHGKNLVSQSAGQWPWQKSAYVVEDTLTAEINDGYLQTLHQWQVRAGIMVPLKKGMERWGMLCVHQCQVPRQWQPEEIEIVTQIAAQLDAALQQADLLLRTRQALGESEIKFQRLAANIPGMIYQCWVIPQHTFSFSYISAGCRDICGLEPDELRIYPQGLLAVIHPDDRPNLEQSLDTAIATLQTWTWEGRILWPDGQIKWVEGTAHLEPQEQGVLMDGLLIDITDRKQTESALRHSESEIRALFAAIPDVMFIIDRDGQYQRIAPTHNLESDQRANDQIAQTLQSVFPQSQAHALLGYVRWVLETKQTLNVEYSLHMDAQETWFHASISPISEDSVIWVARDVSDRKQMEQALRESEAEYRELVENANSIILRWDATGKVTFFNEFAQRFFGYSEEEILGRNILDTILPRVDSYGNDLEAMFHNLMAHPERYINAENENICRNGDRVWIEWTNRALFNEQEELEGMLCVGLDATKRKQAQEALEQAKREAEAANRAKGEFLAMMSHEIRTPMNAVMGMTGLLLDTELTSEQQDFVNTIRNSSDALLTIINDILDFSKIESGRLELEEHPFHLRDCIEGAIELLASKAAEKKLELAYFIGPRVPYMIRGDVTRLRQILVNLLSNAVKFTETGEVIVTVTAQQLGGKKDAFKNTPPIANPQDVQPTLNMELTSSTYPRFRDLSNSLTPIYEIQFSVKDTGIGIPSDRLDRLFQSFSQVDTSITRNYGGTGLGLVISKRLCDLMGGYLWVESSNHIGGNPPPDWQSTSIHNPSAPYPSSPVTAANLGSNFYFTIVAPIMAGSDSPDPQTLYPALPGKRLLIVDDNTTNRKILTLQVQSWGMIVQTAQSGAEALSQIRRGATFDLAILDMHMPKMDGLALAAEIRRIPGYQKLPLVMLTSLGRNEALQKSGNQDITTYLNKPLKQSQLQDILNQLLVQQASDTHFPHHKPTKRDIILSEQHPLRILLAEDHVVNQKLALLMLRRLGYRADVAGNGLEVLEALHRQPYDVVLMDIHMPEMDGLAATRQIRQEWPSGQRPHIVALTASAMQGDREECLNAGMDDYITKPVRIEVLAQVLRRCTIVEPTKLESTIVSSMIAPLATDTSLQPLSPSNNKPPYLSPDNNNPSMLTSETVLDFKILEAIQEIAEDDDNFLAEMIDCYVQTTPNQLQALTTAMLHKDATGIKQTAHPLRSMSAALGAITLANYCRQIEEMARQENLEFDETHITQLQTEYQRAISTLESIAHRTSNRTA